MITSNTGQRRANLITQIRQAFFDVDREEGVSLHEADVIDDHGSAQQQEVARKLDSDRVWWDVPEADIERYHWILSFLDPVGFRYYLPAYMTWTLKYYDQSNSLSANYTIYTLRYTNKLREHAMSRYSFLNQEQSVATYMFLRFIIEVAADYTDVVVARQAVDQYWGQFC